MRLLSHGRLGGSGRLLILPVDQGIEPGPARSFAINPAADDPHYHFQLAIDVVAYAAHLAVELGAHIVKAKLPSEYIEQEAARDAYANGNWSDPAERVRHVVEAAFAGRRLVLFSGGASRDTQSPLGDVRAIQQGGGSGSIVGRNSFQRPRADALAMLDEIVRIHAQKAPPKGAPDRHG